jgi:hypothetical protein
MNKNNTKELLELIEKYLIFPQRFLLIEDKNFVYSESDEN